MEAALDKITKDMDERLAKIMSSFDDQLADLESLGVDIPGFEEWEKNFDEEEWRKAHPEDAAMIDSMFAAPEGGYLGDIDIEMPKLNIDKEKYIEDIKKIAEADA